MLNFKHAILNTRAKTQIAPYGINVSVLDAVLRGLYPGAPLAGAA